MTTISPPQQESRSSETPLFDFQHLTTSQGTQIIRHLISFIAGLAMSVLLFPAIDRGGLSGAPLLPVTRKNSQSSAIVQAARTQIGRTTIYDPSYVVLTYPGGDVPQERGVCTDVVIRALRDAQGMDLQKLVHEEMRSSFSKYPRSWGLKRPDRNIDHRRVSNLMRFFERKGWSLAVSKNRAQYIPGDLVTCMVKKKLPHIMIVSDRTSSDGTPLIIHNIGAGAREENRLFEFPLTGHYRIKGK